MGILSTILGADNPIAQWTVQNRNLLNQWGAGIGSGTDLGEGFANAARLGPAGAQADAAYAASQEAEAKRQEQLNATTQYLQAKFPDLASAVSAGMPLDSAWNEAMKRSQPGYGQAEGMKPMEINGQLVDPMTGKVLGDYRTPETAKGGSAEVALQPTWLQDAQGNWVLGQLAKDGSVVQTKLPPGMSPASPGELAGNRTSGTVDAKTAAAARAALPGAEQMQEITKKALAEVRNNMAGMKEWFSQIGARGLYVNPGSEMGKFVAAASPTNAQAFMQARDMLKGGGPITDYEGRRAEDAMSRMQAALDTGDQQAYLKAIADFEDAVAVGYQKLVETAQGGYSAGAVGAAPAGGNTTSSGVSWKVKR